VSADAWRPETLALIATGTPQPLTQLRPIVVIDLSDLLAVAPRVAWTSGSGQASGAINIRSPIGYLLHEVTPLRYWPIAFWKRVRWSAHDWCWRRILRLSRMVTSRASFHITLPSQGAHVAATLEFISGARFGSGIDGVQVEIWWFDSADGASPGKLLGQVGASDNGNATNLPGDLSLNGGQTGELRIIVRARANSGNDWLTWTQLTVSPN
jgi:hypothetical protein